MTSVVQAQRRFISNTKQISKQSALTFNQISEITGVSASTLRRIAKAKSRGQTYSPMLKTAIRLANASNLTVDAYISTPIKFQ